MYYMSYSPYEEDPFMGLEEEITEHINPVLTVTVNDTVTA